MKCESQMNSLLLVAQWLEGWCASQVAQVTFLECLVDFNISLFVIGYKFLKIPIKIKIFHRNLEYSSPRC